MSLPDLRVPTALRGSAQILRSASGLAGTKSIAQWERPGGGFLAYGAPNHHTLSVYLKGGRGVQQLLGTKRTSPLGQGRGGPTAICVLPRDYETAWTNSAYVSMFHIYFAQAELEALMGRKVGSLRPVVFGQDPIAQALVRNLILELDWSAPADRLSLEHAILSLLARLQAVKPPASGVSGLSTAQIGLIEEVMRGAPAAAHPIAELAALLDCSPRHFARCFKAATGLTPGQRLRQIRIAHARKLILAGQELAGVALECGYSSQSHLTSQFKAETGMTPGAFRRNGFT